MPRPGSRHDVGHHREGRREHERGDDRRGAVHQDHAERDRPGADPSAAGSGRPGPPIPKPQEPSPSSSAIPTRSRSRRDQEQHDEREAGADHRGQNLAAAMRRRLGSRVNVTRPVRCDHSLVTARMPSTGSRKPCGVAAMPDEVVVGQVGGLPEDQRRSPSRPAVSRPIEISSHCRPGCPSGLRSSTRTSRENGTRGIASAPDAVQRGQGRSCGHLLMGDLGSVHVAASSAVS